ncbi:hypothetical protein ACHAXR_011825, partial [Thalassiosira sp. AJA248-18]
IGLRCFQRSGTEAIPGCSGETSYSGTDFCYERPSPNHLWKMGNNWVPAQNFPLKVCEGDCDNDGDCDFANTGLKCFARSGHEAVPGCIGEGTQGAGRGDDICYVPPAPTPHPTRSPLPPTLDIARPLEDIGNNMLPAHMFPLDACQGDCDHDGECQDGLVCFKRNGFEAIPGCEGQGSSGDDYCFHRPPNYLWKMGNNWIPADAFPLKACEGDCDNDVDCDYENTGLKCFARDGHEAVPGCIGEGDGNSGMDICFDPTLTDEPTPNPSQSPTPAPTDSPSRSPSMSPTLAPTTASPTNAPTLNEVSNVFDKESYVAVFCTSPDTRMGPRAIDGSTEKFLCDRTGQAAEDAAALIIIPSHNLYSIAHALRVYSNDDCSGCDPASYILEGRLEPDDAWVEISQGPLPWSGSSPDRNVEGQAVSSSYESGDANLVFTEVSFHSNTQGYLQYKLTFPSIRDASSSSSLQFAEVELAGVLFEHSGLQIESPDPFVQAISCPSTGSSKITAPGNKIASPAGTDVYCGIFIQKGGSGALIPYTRSYNNHEWEASPGPLAIPADGIACTAVDCDLVLPDLEDDGDTYIILAKDGAQDDKYQIASFLELTTFGPKKSEIQALLDNGSWDEAARAQHIRAQMDLPATSHREYFRKRLNAKVDDTRQIARSDHPCDPNSKWRKYSFTMDDRYHDMDGSDIETTFEFVPEEDDLAVTIYEADREEDVSSFSHGGFKQPPSSERYGFSGSGYYDFASSSGDWLEWDIDVSEAGTYPISFRYSVYSRSYNGNRPLQLWVNGNMVEDVYNFPYTGSKNYWLYTDVVEASLNLGQNNIKLLLTDQNSGPDIDHLRVGKPQAIVIKTNGWPRTVAKNGLRIRNDWSFQFTEEMIVKFDDYPDAPSGDLYKFPNGRIEFFFPDGSPRYLDVGNLPVDFTGYEQYLPENYFEFDDTEVWDETASDTFPYPLLKGQELLLRNGLNDNSFCDAVPSFASEGNAPIFGKYLDTWLIWTPKLQLEDNGPSINDDPEDMANNVLSDGGGEWSANTGGKLKCSNVQRSFVNEKTCFLSTENTTCASPEGSTEEGVIVCGSLGEVANDPSLPETFAISTEEVDPVPSDVRRNQKHVVWTEIAINEQDQLRQRMAWALAQIVTTVPSNIDDDERTEMYVNFYDIFVRNSFGNYRDILAEASYSPLMAEHLTYRRSKSHSYVYDDEEKRISRPDENYAREIMQLFSIGLIVLNDDGTPVLDPTTGNALETYTNDDIESFARAWTGFERTGVRGNYEESGTWSHSNRLDPMRIIPDWRDPFPKSHLKGGFIGDGYLLCKDLPAQSFLKKGAGYRLLGGKSSPELMKDTDFFKDDSNDILRAELGANSALYQRLYNNGNYQLFIELDDDLVCTTGTVECDVDTLRVVKVGPVYYEFVERPCVQTAFFDSGKQIQLRHNTLQGQMCANTDLAHAREACCKEDQYQEVRKALMETGVTYLYEGERMTWATAQDRCVAYGRDLCLYEAIDVIPNDDSERMGYHWTNKDCSINVKISREGHIAIVHDAMSSYKDTIPWLVEEENTLNWFRVFWNNGSYPGDSDTNSCAANNCKAMTDGSCLCKTIVTESAVFTDIANLSKEDIMSELFIGALAPQDGDGSNAAVIANDLTVHTIGGNVDASTVFEVKDKGRILFFKNMLSMVSLEGWTMPPQIYEAEDATMNNTVSLANVLIILILFNWYQTKPYFFLFVLFGHQIARDNTDSATGGVYVEARNFDETSYLEWNVNVPTAGTYFISLRYALDAAPRPLSVFVNTKEVSRQLANPNDQTTIINHGSSPAEALLPLQRCAGDCDGDSDCGDGLFCLSNSNYEAVPGCIGYRPKGHDYCVDINDFAFGFTLLPTGGWDDDWQYSEPLEVSLTAGSNTVRVQLPPEYASGANIDHLKVEGLPTSTSPASFRNPPHFMSLIPDAWPDGVGERNLRDAQYETEAVLDHYFYHDNVAPFLCTRIMQRFSFSNPSPRFVSTCVDAFRTGIYTSGSESFGSGKYGSLEAMAASIFLDREATEGAISSDPSYGSIREPMLKVTNLMRSMDYQTSIPTNIDGAPLQTTYNTKLWRIDQKIGHGPYDFPSVFSYMLPEYVPNSGPNLPAKLTSPESMLVTMPNVVSMLNGLLSLVKYGLSDCKNGFSFNSGYGDCVDDGQYETSIGHLMHVPTGADDHENAAELALLLTAGRLSEDSLNTIVDACSDESDQPSKTRCMQQLIITTGEFHATNRVEKSGEDRAGEAAVGDSTEPYKAIVYYYLGGGLDSYNMLTPHTCANDVYDRYRTIRGKSGLSEGLGLPLSRLLEIQIPGNNPPQPCSSFGIHEHLQVLQELYDDEKLIFIANAGLLPKPQNVSNYRDTPAQLFSHNGMCLETQREDLFDEFGGTGVGGRIADVLTQSGIPVNTFSIDGQQVLLTGVAGQGPSQFTLSGSGMAPFNEDPSIENMDAVIKSLNNDTTAESGFFAETWSSKLSEVFAKQGVLKAELDQATTATQFPEDSGTADEFKVVTQIMQTAEARGSKRDIFYVSTGGETIHCCWGCHSFFLKPANMHFHFVTGFDTHSNEDARLIEKFTKMDAALKAFVDELKNLGMWESTVLVQFTEFGRTLDPNSGFGSDHAWGGHHFMFGGGVNGGKVLGQYPSDFEEGDAEGIVLSRGRIIPTSPWDAMWFGVAEWFGIPANGAEMDKVLPLHKNFPPSKLYSKEDLFNIFNSNGEESTS